MICLTRLNGKQFWLNAELIETVETTPDVVITLVNSRKYVVKESVQQIVESIHAYRQRVRPQYMEEGAPDEL